MNDEKDPRLELLDQIKGALRETIAKIAPGYVEHADLIMTKVIPMIVKRDAKQEEGKAWEAFAAAALSQCASFSDDPAEAVKHAAKLADAMVLERRARRRRRPISSPGGTS